MAVVACVVVSVAACRANLVDEAAVKLWGGDLSTPSLDEVRAVSPVDVTASFSAPVTVIAASVTLDAGQAAQAGAVDSADSAEPGNQADESEAPARDGGIAVTWQPAATGNGVVFSLERSPGPGKRAVLAGTVSDALGDTLSFAVPFTGYNDRVPRLRLSEVRMDYSKPKVEYVEIVALTAGNLGGVELFNGANEAVPVRVFPPVEVRAGEIIVWHFRAVEEGLVSELGALDESAGTNASPSARDFWDNQARSPVKKTNVLWLRERRGGTIMDALACAEPGKADWPTDALKAAALEAVTAGAWKPGGTIADAASTAGMSPTRTLARNTALDDTDTASDWKVCATGKCSPGAKNPPW